MKKQSFNQKVEYLTLLSNELKQVKKEQADTKKGDLEGYIEDLEEEINDLKRQIKRHIMLPQKPWKRTTLPRWDKS
ncbi:MAG: hypothetical protein HOC24_10935 [Deltaproteobacteria bacterium]|jgi:hypothetical protein|nr:hypothetical protein [Deltaproteobacteria bacterium]